MKTFVRLLGFPVGHCKRPMRDVSPEIQEGMKWLIEEFELKKIYNLK